MRSQTIHLFEDVGLPAGEYKTRKGWRVFVFPGGFSLLFLKKRVLLHRYDEVGRAWLRKRGQWRGREAGYAPLSWSLSLPSCEPFAREESCPLIEKLEKHAKEQEIMKPLAKRQEELLLFIHQYQTENYISPSIREMREKMGILSSNGVNNHLLALTRKGHVEKIGEGRSRAWTLTEQGREYVGTHGPEPESQDRGNLLICAFCEDVTTQSIYLSVTKEESKACCPSCLKKLALIGARVFFQLGGREIDWLVGESLESLESTRREPYD